MRRKERKKERSEMFLGNGELSGSDSKYPCNTFAEKMHKILLENHKKWHIRLCSRFYLSLSLSLRTKFLSVEFSTVLGLKVVHFQSFRIGKFSGEFPHFTRSCVQKLIDFNFHWSKLLYSRKFNKSSLTKTKDESMFWQEKLLNLRS